MLNQGPSDKKNELSEEAKDDLDLSFEELVYGVGYEVGEAYLPALKKERSEEKSLKKEISNQEFPKKEIPKKALTGKELEQALIKKKKAEQEGQRIKESWEKVVDMRPQKAKYMSNV